MQDLDLGDVSTFVQVVESGSFSAAAQAMNTPRSSVSRRVARLEETLGVRLLHRTTRSIALTDAGRSYHERVSVALSSMHEAANAVATRENAARGVVRLCAPPDVGAEVLPRLVAGFLARHPEVELEVTLSSSPPSLVQGGFDLALRVGPQPDSNTVVRKLQDPDFGLYAAPGYLSKAPPLERPEDLEAHACLLFRPQARTLRWSLHGPGGPVEVRVRGPVSANDLSFIRRAAIAGLGVALLPEVVVEGAALPGELERVLPEFRSVGHPVFVAYPSASNLPRQVELFRDFLLECFPEA